MDDLYKTEKIGIKQRFIHLLRPKVPAGLKKRMIPNTDERMKLVDQSLRKNYYADKAEEIFYEEPFHSQYLDNLYHRLEFNRNIIVPWLNSVLCLEKSSILEIGCGTGSASLAFAEQGAQVTGLDVWNEALQVAKDRLNIYGVKGNFINANSTEIKDKLGDNNFDLIIFFASLEHMTYAERITSIQQAWDILPGGKILCIIGTPNRLWYYDNHSSFLPFFHWLPPEMAFEYFKFSPMNQGMYEDNDNDTIIRFFRNEGLGASFHEFDIAIRPVESLKIISSLSKYYDQKVLWRLINRFRKSRRYMNMLKSYSEKNIHDGFFDSYLNIAIVKD